MYPADPLKVPPLCSSAAGALQGRLVPCHPAGCSRHLGILANVPQSLQGTGVVSLCCRGWDLAIRPPKKFCWCSEPLSSDKCQFLFSHQGSDHRDIDQYCYLGLKAHENLTKRIIDLWIFLPCVQGLEDPVILLEMAEGIQRGRCAMRQLLKSRFSDSYAVTPINQALQVVFLVMLCKPHVVEGKD